MSELLLETRELTKLTGVKELLTVSAYIFKRGPFTG